MLERITGDSNDSKYAAIAGVFNVKEMILNYSSVDLKVKTTFLSLCICYFYGVILASCKGQSKFLHDTSIFTQFHQGLKGFVGPIDLGGEKAGFDFGIELSNDWPEITKSQVDQYVSGNIPFSFLSRDLNEIRKLQ